MKLLSVSQDAKTLKSLKKGYLTGILYMAPHTIGGHNVCPMATAGCSAACLYTAGRARVFNSIQQARIRRKEFYFNDRKGFIAQLHKEIEALDRKAQRDGYQPAIRLNGTSDILGKDYLRVIRSHSHIPFYDYTKVHKRMITDLPDNYSLTFSRSETNNQHAVEVLRAGGNVAIVFNKLPEYWHEWKVIDGDQYDARFLDPTNVVVGLKAKGDALRDTSGFVVQCG